MNPRLTFTRGGHSYDLDGRRIDGVTTAIGKGLPKPALVPWATGAAADFVVEHWDELATDSPSTKISKIKGAPWALRDRAALRGTKIHGYGEDLVHGRAVEIPDEYVGPADAYAKFLDEWKIEPIATETPLANTTHRYGGTADLWATIGVRGHAPALIDVKTGKDAYPDVALQLAAYRYADLWQPDGPTSENDDVPDVDLVFVAHVLPDAVRMLPIVAGPAEHRAFLYVLQTARWVTQHAERVKGEDGEWGVRAPLVGRQEVAS